jgi:hypothetical protein
VVASERGRAGVAHRSAQWRRYQDRYEPAERLIFIATSISRRPDIEIWTSGHHGQSRQSKRQSRTLVRSRRWHSLYLALHYRRRRANYSEIFGLRVNQIAVMHRDVSRVRESILKTSIRSNKSQDGLLRIRTLCRSYQRCACLIILTALPPATAQNHF